MVVEKFISTQKLAKYLDQEIEARLVERQIYDIGHYGWLDGDTYDPEFLGHAMWQVQSPLLNDHLNLGFPDIPVTHKPTKEEVALVVTGRDFEDALLALVIYQVADRYIISPEWYERADAEANELRARRNAEAYTYRLQRIARP